MHLELLEQILISQGEANARLEIIQTMLERFEGRIERLERAVIALMEERAVATGKLSAFFTPEKNRCNTRDDYSMIPEV